jgi:hypothetical protein
MPHLPHNKHQPEKHARFACSPKVREAQRTRSAVALATAKSEINNIMTE